jgi:dTDP-4-amino-4,6-dideoxygalactose transaminase
VTPTDWRVTLTDVALTDADVEAALDALRSGWLTMGPRTQELESAFAEQLGCPHAIAVSSGTAALHLACLAVGLGPGDEAIVPASGFVAAAHAPRCAGAEVVLADSVSATEPLLDPDELERRITPRTRAVIAVHSFGYPADVERLASICDRHGLALIEDCADAAGGRLRDGRWAGTAGACGCFSLFSKTRLGVGEGGIVVTADPDIAERVRSLRSHAMTSVTWDRHRGHAESYDVTDLGFNYRLDEPRAALARSRLGALERSVAALRGVAEGYRDRLAALDGVELCFDDESVKASGHFACPVLVRDGATRDEVRERMHAAGVQTTFYPALTRLTAYAPADGAAGAPVAEEFADRHLALPMSPSLDPDQIELVVGELGAALA